MKRLPFVIVAIAALFSCAAVAAVSIAPNQKVAICGKRTTCGVTAVHNAGTLQVAEVHFGLKDKPDDAPDDGCRSNDDEKRDGGTEYWLLGAKPLQILELCNDGYGAASVGEDHVSFGSNRMMHAQYGGSSWRWKNDDVYSLVPFRLLSQVSCSYHNLSAAVGDITTFDLVKYRAVTIAKNPGAKWSDDDSDIGCPQAIPAMFVNPKPEPGSRLVAAFPLMMPGNGPADTAFQNLGNGIALGSCSTIVSTDGRNGFLTFGKPADPSHVAEMRVLAPDMKTLLLQIYDPLAARASPAASWLSTPHAEVWIAAGYEPEVNGAVKRSLLGQFAIELNGTLHVMGKAPAPAVTHWIAKDGRGRAVTVLKLAWKDDTLLTAVVSYSQAEAGRQARLVTNTAMSHGVPVYLPALTGVSAKCAIRGGRVELASANGVVPDVNIR